MTTFTALTRNTKATSIVSAVCRFGLAALWFYSGIVKFLDPVGTQKSVEAYELFPTDFAQFIGTVLPLVEIALGILFLLGIFLRPVSVLSGVMFVAFAVGIASAWARGLTIDCGCFGIGGQNPDVTWATYFWGIAKNVLFLAMAAWTVWRPFRTFAIYP